MCLSGRVNLSGAPKVHLVVHAFGNLVRTQPWALVEMGHTSYPVMKWVPGLWTVLFATITSLYDLTI